MQDSYGTEIQAFPALVVPLEEHPTIIQNAPYSRPPVKSSVTSGEHR